MPPRGASARGRFELWFTTAAFDIDAEPPNEPNARPGHSLLTWLRPRLEGAGFTTDEPWGEDWGWCLQVLDASGRRYAVGANALVAESARPLGKGVELEWVVQVWRRRTLIEWLRRAAVAQRDDPLVRFVEGVFLGPGFRDRLFLGASGEVLHEDG